MERKKIKRRAANSQKIKDLNRNFPFEWKTSDFLKIVCQAKKKIKILITILKTIVFPQSGGENQGGKFNKGKTRIEKIPAK